LVKVEKYFIPMKGNISQEIGECQKALKILNGIVIEKKEFLLPIENSHRTILKIKKMSATSNEYPRKNSEIKKRPL
jgi:16S rRNA (guanine527-N7)-methyltransferase